MGLKSIYSVKSTVKEMAKDLKEQLKDFDEELVLYFASENLNQKLVAKEMKEVFGEVDVVGCSSAGEIVSGDVLENSIVAMAFNKESIEDYKIELVRNLKKDDGSNVEKAFRNFETHYDVKSKDMEFEKYLGIVIFDWIAQAEEKTMAKLGALSNVGFIGCSAADNLKFEKTYVHVNGEALTDVAVLMLLKPKKKFHFVKTQNFCSLGKSLRATKVNAETRTVVEFDGKPAAEAYAEALGVSIDELPDKFFEHPVGLDVGNDFYVRSPQKVEGKNVVFFCNILENQNLQVLEPTNIIKDTKEAFESLKENLPSVSGVIDFHCILRTLDLRNKGLTKEYGKIFEGSPMIGLASYGQQFIGHIDQTSMLLVFE